jgi:hypothetical protein
MASEIADMRRDRKLRSTVNALTAFFVCPQLYTE